MIDLRKLALAGVVAVTLPLTASAASQSYLQIKGKPSGSHGVSHGDKGGDSGGRCDSKFDYACRNANKGALNQVSGRVPLTPKCVPGTPGCR
jgi:hypothetical protein